MKRTKINSNLKVILIGNYKKDKQESMLRFLGLLKNGLDDAEISNEVWFPICFFGYLINDNNKGIGKWIFYLDKYLLTIPIWWIKALKKTWENKNTIYHICDHSNAVYQGLFQKKRLLLTCHDVIAIRGALGYKDAYCNASFTGKILQKIILNQLERVKHIAFVSNNTCQQFLEISNQVAFDKTIIRNGQNWNYRPIGEEEKLSLRENHTNLPNVPYLLHVGSNLERKNRKLLIETLHILGNTYTGQLCFAGKAPDVKLWKIIKQHQLEDRIFVVENPTNEMLNFLYNQCDAFLFPSYSEGFGWPIIEAQACGAPVICSAMEPFFEIAGKGALYANPLSPKSFADEILKLRNHEFKKELTQYAIINSRQYDTKTMIQKYIEAYKKLSQ